MNIPMGRRKPFNCSKLYTIDHYHASSFSIRACSRSCDRDTTQTRCTYNSSRKGVQDIAVDPASATHMFARLLAIPHKLLDFLFIHVFIRIMNLCLLYPLRCVLFSEDCHRTIILKACSFGLSK